IIFQQDNNLKHKSHHAQQWFSDHRFNTLPWLPNYPKQNIIENAWFELEKVVSKHKHHLTNTTELWEVLQEECRNLPEELLDNLYDNILHCLIALHVVKGQWTKS
ncbi:hypothetical protein BT96DRAFT_823364, partial [Gymnopus androsaceus JB14]